MSVEKALHLESSPADPMRFIPMKLGPRNCTIGEPNPADSFELPPSPAAVHLFEPLKLAQTRTFRHDLGGSDLANQLEVHAGPLVFSNCWSEIREVAMS